MKGSNKPSPDDPVVIPLEDYKPEPKPLVCRMCFARRIEPDGPCPSCGFDERTGLTASTRIGKRSIGDAGLTCAKCGYNLQGLRSPRCPECGTVAIKETRRAYDREESKRIARQAYLMPSLMLVIGMALLIPTWFYFGGAQEAIIQLIVFAIVEVPIGVGIFLLCCLIWIGFDAPIHLTALRLAGIYAVVGLIGAYTSLLPLGFLVPIVIYIGLLAHLLEMEINDAILVGLITWFAKVFLAMAIIMSFA